MPEGDTIFRAARALEKALSGRMVTGFETAVAKLASVNDDKPVVGRIVERVESRGKWLLMHFSGDLILATHMLMSGSWHIYRVGERWRIRRSHMRAVVTCGEFQAVLFNAQIAEFYTARSLERSAQMPKLGPDILSANFTVENGVDAMRTYAAKQPEAEIAVVLLNQRVMAGLGNVYKSEVAFAAGVHPFRQMATITEQEMRKIVEVSERYMRANVADGAGDGIVTYSGNRRTTRSMDREERLWVYGRKGEECRRCGALIARRLQGVQARPTYWCEICQPWIGASGQNSAAPEGNTTRRTAGRRRNSC